MFDDLTFTPRNDLDVLVVSVMERGRQRRIQRRAMTGGVAALAVMLIAAGSIPFTLRATNTTRPNVAERAPDTVNPQGPFEEGRSITPPESPATKSDGHRAHARHATAGPREPGATRPPSAQANRRTVAFVSDIDDGANDVYLHTPGADRPVRITDNPAVDTWPTWSPDAKRIAFYSQRDGHSEIYVMDADGSNQHRITPIEAEFDNTQPAWSPDGKLIAFARAQGTPNASLGYEPEELSVIAPDGSNLHGLGVAGAQPSWAPDSRHIAFVNATGDLLVLDIGSTAPARVLVPAGGSLNERPAFSPDGRQIAFSRLENGVAQLYVIDADGTGGHRLLHTDDDALGAAWSPDGSTIVYSDQPRIFCIDVTDPTTCHVDMNATSSLWTVRADGLQTQPLVQAFGNVGEAQFAPTEN